MGTISSATGQKLVSVDQLSNFFNILSENQSNITIDPRALMDIGYSETAAKNTPLTQDMYDKVLGKKFKQLEYELGRDEFSDLNIDLAGLNTEQKVALAMGAYQLGARGLARKLQSEVQSGDLSFDVVAKAIPSQNMLQAVDNIVADTSIAETETFVIIDPDTYQQTVHFNAPKANNKPANTDPIIDYSANSSPAMDTVITFDPVTYEEQITIVPRGKNGEDPNEIATMDSDDDLSAYTDPFAAEFEHLNTGDKRFLNTSPKDNAADRSAHLANNDTPPTESKKNEKKAEPALFDVDEVLNIDADDWATATKFGKNESQETIVNQPAFLKERIAIEIQLDELEKQLATKPTGDDLTKLDEDVKALKERGQSYADAVELVNAVKHNSPGFSETSTKFLRAEVTHLNSEVKPRFDRLATAVGHLTTAASDAAEAEKTAATDKAKASVADLIAAPKNSANALGADLLAHMTELKSRGKLEKRPDNMYTNYRIPEEFLTATGDYQENGASIEVRDHIRKTYGGFVDGLPPSSRELNAWQANRIGYSTHEWVWQHYAPALISKFETQLASAYPNVSDVLTAHPNVATRVLGEAYGGSFNKDASTTATEKAILETAVKNFENTPEYQEQKFLVDLAAENYTETFVTANKGNILNILRAHHHNAETAKIAIAKLDGAEDSAAEVKRTIAATGALKELYSPQFVEAQGSDIAKLATEHKTSEAVVSAFAELPVTQFYTHLLGMGYEPSFLGEHAAEISEHLNKSGEDVRSAAQSFLQAFPAPGVVLSSNYI